MRDMSPASGFSLFIRLFALTMMLFGGLSHSVRAQENPVIPNFWDPQERFIKPNVKDLPRLRFLTTTDFPPFSYIDKEKRLTGFHIDLARAICAELEVLPVCQIQALPFAELQQQLDESRGEAIIAGMAKRNTCQNGKFHGITASTTPSGKKFTKLFPASVSTGSGARKRAPFLAVHRQTHAHFSTSAIPCL